MRPYGGLIERQPLNGDAAATFTAAAPPPRGPGRLPPHPRRRWRRRAARPPRYAGRRRRTAPAAWSAARVRGCRRRGRRADRVPSLTHAMSEFRSGLPGTRPRELTLVFEKM